MPSGKVQIRKLKEGQNEDYWAAVQIIDHALGEKCHNTHQLYSQLQNIPRTYVAVDGGKIVGGLIWKYYEVNQSMQLEFVAVDPEAKGRGIGSQLVKACMSHVSECRKKGAEIKTFTLDANHTNYTFFQKLGWGFVDNEPSQDYWGPVEMSEPTASRIKAEIDKLR